MEPPRKFENYLPLGYGGILTAIIEGQQFCISKNFKVHVVLQLNKGKTDALSVFCLYFDNAEMDKLRSFRVQASRCKVFHKGVF